MMKLFILTPRVPWPLEKGDKLRAYHQIRLLSESFEVCLCCLSDGDVHPDSINELSKIASQVHIISLSRPLIFWRLLLAIFSSQPYQIHYFFQSRAQKKIKKILKDFQPDRIYCQLIRAAEYVKHLHEVPKTLDYMDAFNMGHSRRLSGSSWPMKLMLREEAKRLARYENLIFEYFERHTIISAQDRELIFHPSREKIHVISNGVDTEFFRPQLEIKKDVDILFTGNMGYPPNIDCAIFLANEVMPLVCKQLPNAILMIAGANPSNDVLRLAATNILVPGWMNDIRDAYARSKVFAAPMRIGTGLQNKILEAMSMEIPCITSQLAAGAMSVTNGKECLIADQAEEVANAIVKLLNDQPLCESLKMNAKSLVEQHFSWEGTVSALAEIIRNSNESAAVSSYSQTT